jgi:hypothetical protein
MSLEGLRTQDIAEAALLNLIAAQVPEGKTVDYKAELPGMSDGAKKDFLADLCSFANAGGGHMIYGMTEAEGLPTKLAGLSDDIDQAILRLESMARYGIRPPIPGLEIVRVNLSGGAGAVVVRIPRSWNAPHQVIFQKDFRFYTRGSAGKQHLDVDELRRIVLQSQEVGERIRQFRAGRIAAILANETPVELLSGAREILHFVPLTAFGAGAAVDLSAIAKDRALLVAAMNHGGSMRHNVDGAVAFSSGSGGNDAYAQLYRNGVLEIVALIHEWNPRGQLVLPSLSFEQDVFAQTKAALALLDRLGAPPPIAAMLTFTGIKGWEMGAKDDYGRRRGHGGFDRDPLLIPELMIPAFEVDDVPRLVKPMIDATWNAGGFPQSDYYDQQGNWVGEQRR